MTMIRLGAIERIGKTMKFKLTVDLDNEGMTYSTQLATALRKVAERIENNSYVETCEDEHGEMITRGIQDENGNHVGSWSVWDENTSMTTPDKPIILIAHEDVIDHTVPYDDAEYAEVIDHIDDMEDTELPDNRYYDLNGDD